MKLVFQGEDGSRADLQSSLHEWLRRSDQLVRSQVDLVARSGTPGEMGGMADLVMNLNVVEVTAAVSAIMAWLRFRGADIDAERTADGDVKIRLRRIRHRDVRETEKLLTDLIQRGLDAHQSREDQRQ
jgi:hypothetical protein